MKILLVSDSHGYDDELKKVLENVKCDLKIHCGDSCFDRNSPFIKEFAAIVDGNHDQGFFPLTATLPTALGNILITHGHKFNVYAGYDYLVEYMNKADIHICFHGHTHVPHYEIYKNKIFINPGSIMFNRGQSQCGSYAIVSVDDKLHVDFFDSRTQKKIPQSLIDKDQDILNEFKRFACQKKYYFKWRSSFLFLLYSIINMISFKSSSGSSVSKRAILAIL